MRSREGFFQAAAELANDPLTNASTIERVDALREWFADNLDVPVRFSRGNAKGSYCKDTKGLSWFKSNAVEHIAKAFELKHLLDEFRYPIEVLKEDRIGYVIFEDAHQVVAEPFADTAR